MKKKTHTIDVGQRTRGGRTYSGYVIVSNGAPSNSDPVLDSLEEAKEYLAWLEGRPPEERQPLERLTTYIRRKYSSILVHREPPKARPPTAQELAARAAREAVRAATVRMRTALVEGLALVPDGPVRLSLERTIALLDTDIRGYQTPGAERLAAKLAADADYYDTLSLSTDAEPPQVARDHVTHLLLRAASLALLSMHRGESDEDDAQEIIGLVISAAEAAIGSEVRAEIAAETREAWRAAWKNSEEHQHAIALQASVAARKASRLKAAQMAARNMADAINGSVGGHDGQRG